MKQLKLNLTDNSIETVTHLSEDDYHGTIRSDTGKPFLSSSALKKYMNINLFHELGEAAKFGNHVHAWIQGQIDPSSPFSVLPPFKNERGDAIKKNTKAFVAALEETRAELPHDFIVLNNSEYAAFRAIADALTPFIEEFKKSFSCFAETNFFVGKDHLKDHAHPFFSDIFSRYFDAGAKIRPDVITLDEGGIHIYDWKTTSKHTVEDFIWQCRKLDYLFSLWYYGEILKIVFNLPIASINLIPLPKSTNPFRASMVTLSPEELENALDFDVIEQKLNRGANYFKQVKTTGIMRIKFEEF